MMTAGQPLDFDAWCDLSARIQDKKPEEQLALLEERGLTEETWLDADARHQRVLAEDMRAHRMERVRRYGAAFDAELKRRGQVALPPDAPTQAPPPAPEAKPSEETPVPTEPPPLTAAWLSNQAADAPPPADVPAPLPPPIVVEPPQPRRDLTVDLRGNEPSSTPLPFHGSPPSSPSSSRSEPPPAHVDTGTVEMSSSPGAHAATVVAGLTLSQYASLSAELSAGREAPAAVLAKYGIDGDEARQRVVGAWNQVLARDAAARTTWLQLAAQFRAWLAQQPEKK